MKIELLNVGWLNVPAGVMRTGDPMDEQARLPIPAYLIDERILVDVGPHPSSIGEAIGPFVMEQERPLVDLVDLSALEAVVLTHLHFDHAGALALLPESVPVVLQRAEWEAGRDPAAIERNFYRPSDYEQIADRVQLVDGDASAFGVELLFTPGHTPGHQSVRVGDTVIGGDVTIYASGYDDERFPVFGDDLEAQAASARRLRALRDAGVRVLPGHDPQVLVTM